MYKPLPHSPNHNDSSTPPSSFDNNSNNLNTSASPNLTTSNSTIKSFAAIPRMPINEPNLVQNTALKIPPPPQVQPHQQLIAASLGGLICAFVTCPFDVIKTRLQIQTEKPNQLSTQQFRGTWDAFVKISRYEGVPKLWRGLAPSIMMSVPNSAIYFNSYDFIKNTLVKGELIHNAFIPMFAGSLARVVTVSILSPLELIRTNLQAISRGTMKNAVSSFVNTMGVKGLWLGASMTLLRDVPFSAIYWTSYETTKRHLSKICSTKKQSVWAPFLIAFTSGAASGMLAGFVTTPIDLVKTRLQTQPLTSSTTTTTTTTTTTRIPLIANACSATTTSNLPKLLPRQSAKDICVTIWRQEGPAGFMKGWLPRAVKVAPACAIMISTFEAVKALFV